MYIYSRNVLIIIMAVVIGLFLISGSAVAVSTVEEQSQSAPALELFNSGKSKVLPYSAAPDSRLSFVESGTLYLDRGKSTIYSGTRMSSYNKLPTNSSQSENESSIPDFGPIPFTEGEIAEITSRDTANRQLAVQQTSHDEDMRFDTYIINSTNMTANRIAYLESQGIEINRTYDEIAKAQLTPEQISSLQNISWVEQIRRIRYPIQHTISEGVAAINADDVHEMGYTGENIDIGIVDAGFYPSENEIASNVEATRSYHPSGINAQGASHGTAVAEIVTDTAPAADLHLVNFENSFGFRRAVDWLIQQNVDLITTSIGFPYAPQNGESIPSQAAEDAIESGIPFVNSAGNTAQRHWQGRYTDPDRDQFLNVNGLNERIYLGDGQLIRGPVSVALSWNEQRTTTQDYDLYLFRDVDNGEDVVVARSDLEQDGIVPNFESIEQYLDSGVYYLAIYNRNATGTELLEVQTRGTQLRPNNPRGSLMAPADVRGVLTVGAYHYRSGEVAKYSSHGPTDTGWRGINVIAPTGVTTETFPRFTGTSAAAPHVAGVVSLLLGKNPFLTRLNIIDTLQSTAVDYGVSGPDMETGYGAVAAETAIDTVASPADRFEPNDRYTTASLISQDSLPTTYSALTLVEGESDNYAINMDEGMSLDATVRFNNGENLSLRITAPNQSVVRRLTTATGSERIQFTSYTAGTWYITVTGAGNVSNEYSLSLDVETNQPPDSSFNYAPTNPTTGESVRFSATGSSDPDGIIQTYEWDFDGDGTYELTGQTVTHTFSSSGNQTVALRVTDNSGATATTNQTLTVTGTATGGSPLQGSARIYDNNGDGTISFRELNQAIDDLTTQQLGFDGFNEVIDAFVPC